MTPARRPPSRASALEGRPRPPRRPAPPPEPPSADDALVGLEEERQFLLDSLRDLEEEREAGNLDQADYDSLRDDYTARAAAVLRQLEAARTTPRRKGVPAAPAAPATPRRAATPTDLHPRRRTRRTALAVVAVVGLAAVSGVAVAALSGDRVGDQSITGRDLSGPAGRLAEAHALEVDGKAADALRLYDDVLREDPANVEALTYKGWLLARAGLPDPAMAALDQAVALNPRYPDAHFFRGMVLYRSRNDPAAAIVEFEAFLANNPPPDSVAPVREVLERARADVAKAGPTPGG